MPSRGGVTGQDDVRRERDQFCRISAKEVGIARAQRVSIRTLWPSVQPDCLRPLRNSLSTVPMLILAALIVVYLIRGILYESYIHPLTISRPCCRPA